MKNTIALLLVILAITHYLLLQRNHWTLPKPLIQKPILIQGTIVSIPIHKFHGVQFIFHVEQFQHHAISTHFLIAWYQHPPAVTIGERWQLTVKLKPPIGLHNPGGFNYAIFLSHKNIRATGYVVFQKVSNHLLNQNHAYFIDRFRQKIQTQIPLAIHDTTLAAFISALCVGLRDGLTQSDWQVFQKTGTNHLVAIAGLHIGFVAAVIYGCMNFMWRLFPRALLKIPAARIAEMAALIVALLYAALSGFAIPAQRASIMLLVLIGAKLLYRNLSVWKRLGFAFLVIIILQPYVIFNASLWLSFSAVSILAWVLSGRLHTFHGLQAWMRMQGAMVLGILPFTLLFFQQTSRIAFFTNAIAIPWIGFVILPLCLCACVLFACHLYFLSTHLFWLTGKILLPLWKVLCIAAHLSFSSWYHSISAPWILLASVIGVVFLLAPRGLPGRWLGCCGLLPLFFYHPVKPMPGDYWVTVIDVGQGLSVLVQTAQHVMLYDTGAHSLGGLDMGESVVAPFLRLQGISRINRLEISHGDNDHSGGASAIIADFHVDHIFTSAPNLIAQFHANYCVAGQSWTWDGIHFTTLNPASNVPYADNNSSCVIKIEGPGGQLLLTGDIESSTELSLVEQYGKQLRATALIVPHHGSKTSSSSIFLNAVSPQYAVISAGKYNRYRLPVQFIVQRYLQRGAKLYVTAEAGAISIRFLHSGQVKLRTV